MKPLLRLTKTRRAANQATPAVPSESQVSLRPEPRGQITGFRERLRSWARDPGTRLPPHTPSPESQPGITGISTNPSGQLDSQQPVPGLSVANREASNKTESVVNIIVDNLAQAAEICEKIANVVDKAPLIGPLAALVSTILKTCKEIKDTYEHRNNLFKRIERIALDLHGTIMRMETTQYTDGSTGRLKSDIEEYVGLFKKASALLSDFDTQGKLKITVNHKDWESKLAALDRELDSFAGQFNTKRGTDIQIGQSAIRKKVDEVQVLALGKKLQEWLQSPPDMGLKHHATQKLHHEGTGTWFLDGPEFTEWRENPGSLWIEGKSGAGKSVLSSTVIEKLLASSNEAYAVGYFYFDFRKDETQLVETMLRSIILQLSKQSPQPYSTLDQQYENRKGVTPIYDNLRDVLDKLLSELGPTYIVLDALDECKEPDRLIDFISTLQNRTTSPLHLLFTSQSRTDFTAAFGTLTHILLEPATTRDDIIRFVDSELRSTKLKHWKHHIPKITATVVEKSNGMFRLAACLLIELSRRKFDQSPDIILAKLPGDLFAIYGRFLETFEVDDFHHIGRVLRWILFSTRPVTLLELEDVLAFDFHPHEHVFDPTKRGDYANTACELLEGLVTLDRVPSTESFEEPSTVDSTESGEGLSTVGLPDSETLPSMDNETKGPSQVVTLAHASVADYLMSPAFTKQYNCDLSTGPSHTLIAQTCIGYLLHFADNPLNDKTFPDYPLSLYAAKYWGHHLRLCPDREILLSSTMCLLESGSTQFVALNNLYDIDDIEWSTPDWHRKCLSPLYMCSNIGYTEGVRFLLDKGAAVDDTDNEQGYLTPLQIASGEGYKEIVCLLLEKGADVERAEGFSGKTALQYASERGHTEIVRLLLEKGADVERAKGPDATALQQASIRGHTEIVHLLLEKGANVENTGRFGSTALQQASRGGHTEIVRLLLEKGANVERGEGSGTTALQRASDGGHTEIVRLLLEKGADIENTGRFSNTALQHASWRGHTEIVRLLLENGANVERAEGVRGTTALQEASGRGHTEIIHLLLEKGPDVERAGEFGGTALQQASDGGHTEIVHLLLEKGANVETAKGFTGTTALPEASERGHTEVVRLLLEKGTDIENVGRYGGTALQFASRSTQRLFPLTRADIENTGMDATVAVRIPGGLHRDCFPPAYKGADIENTGNWMPPRCRPTSRTGNGCTVAVRIRGYTEMFLLLDKGRHREHWESDGTALQFASREGYTEIVSLLLDKGADIENTGKSDATALQFASREGYTEIVSLLLEKGADVNTHTGFYGSALDAALKSNHLDVIHLLREHGAKQGYKL
ncbi:ankyrin repeat-containing domain protein [Mycena rosella]|uniref:Ankyrin repeat-containing domain protein n=1 Tax=Mycena rosella TaxID=1033263 RepID=A0AAD7G4X2_MYCRO|nr:ankyrin repeat-containing domain protein [Mycena rosella]